MSGPLVILDCNITSSSHGPLTSPPPLFSPCNYNSSNSILDHENIMNDNPTHEVVPPND